MDFEDSPKERSVSPFENVSEHTNQLYCDFIHRFSTSDHYKPPISHTIIQISSWRQFPICYESAALRLPIIINRKTSRGIPFYFSEIKSGRHRNCSRRYLWNWNLRLCFLSKFLIFWFVFIFRFCSDDFFVGHEIGHGAHAIDEWVSASSLERIYKVILTVIFGMGTAPD